MAHEDDDALLAAWLDQVGRMADAADGPDERGYKAVALELGLTEADLARVEAAVDDHISRGQNFLTHGRPDDAVRELKDARALAPWRADVAHTLAEAHVARFHGGGDGADRAAAEALIRARLERDPDHQPSYALLNRLDASPTAPTAPAGPTASTAPAARRRMLLVAGGGVAVMLLVSGLMASLMNSTAPSNPGPTPVEPVELPPETPAETPAPSPPETAEATGDMPPEGKFDLPVEIVSHDEFEGIEVDTAGSMIDRRASYTSAMVHVRVKNTLEGKGLEALQATAEFLDLQGRVVSKKRFALLNSAHSMLYPGEQHAYAHRFTTTAAAERARVIFESLERRTATDPPASKPICVKWDIEQPEHLAFDFGLRGIKWNLGTLSMDLTVRNRGSNAAEGLVFQLDHLDADGAPIAESGILDKETVAASWMPPFEPGELRLAHHMKVLGLDDKPRYDHTCLRITQAD